jgi:hypothetical protein
MNPIYEDEQVIKKHVKRPNWYSQVEPGNRYGEGLNLLLDILECFLRAKDYHDRQENEDRSVHKLRNHGLIFRSEGSKKILHGKVAFPFGRHTRAKENDPDIQVSENFLRPSKALDPGSVSEDHIGKAGHYDDAEENHNQNVPKCIYYLINYLPNTHAFVLFKK